MSRLVRYVAFLLVYLILPGAHEATEQVVHILAHGDLAHNASHGDHHDPAGEHDCTGLFHSCLCHASVLVTVSATAAALAPLPPRRGDALRRDVDRQAAGYPDLLDRPPIV